MTKLATTKRRKRGLRKWATTDPVAKADPEVAKWNRGLRINGAKGKAFRGLTKCFQRLELGREQQSGIWDGATIDAITPWLPQPALGELVIRFAVTQLGVTEHPPYSNRGPEIDRYYAALGWNPSVADDYGWCTFGAFWCVARAVKRLYPAARLRAQLAGVNMAHTGAIWNAALTKANRHLRVSKGRKGDWVCMHFTQPGQHVGLFVRWIVPGLVCRTIEFNTSPDAAGSQSQGGMVCYKTRYRKNIHGYVSYVP
jgi:hypothetical protein